MKRLLFCLSLLALFLMPGQVWAFTAEVTASTQSQNNSVAVVHTAVVTGSATNLWWYIPFPRQTSYAKYFLQQRYSGFPTILPPAYFEPYYENGEEVGVWVYFGNVSNTTLTVRLDITVNVTIVLTGLPGDILRTGSSVSPWCRSTPECPTDLPGLRELAVSLQTQVVPGTDATAWGFISRMTKWMDDTFIWDDNLTQEQSSAAVAWYTKQVNCLALVHIAKSIFGACEPPFASGIMYCYVLGNTVFFPGLMHQFSTSTEAGGHACLAVDTGYYWAIIDFSGHTIGFITKAYINNGVAERIGDISSNIVYNGNAAISWTTQVTGSANAGTFIGQGESSFPTTGRSLACQWVRGSTVGVEEKTGKILDRSKKNTLCVNPYPAINRVDFQLYLEKPAHVLGRVFSSDGRLKKTVVDSELSAEYNYFSLQTGDMASGIYFLRLSLNSGKQVETQKFRVVH